MKSMFLSHSFRTEQFPIIVSLPKNDLSLAQAAMDAGADGIKVHLNVEHRASGTHFGSFSEERQFLEAISDFSIPKAVMIGAERIPSPLEMAALDHLGFESFDLYWKHFRPALLECGMTPMIALDDQWSEKDLKGIAELPNGILEASVVSPDSYRTDLQPFDFDQYARIASLTDWPVIVPTQKRVRLKDIAPLRERGISGLLMGAVVTGLTRESLYEAVRSFVMERDQ